MTRTRRRVWDRTIYKFWVQYLKQIEWWEGLSPVYKDWNLGFFGDNKTDTGIISQEDFNLWWEDKGVELFGEDNFTGDVQEIGGDEDFTNKNYVYLKVEIPPVRIDGKGTLTRQLNKMTEDNLKSILSSKKRKPPRFPVGSHHGGLGQVEKRLEFYIWKQNFKELPKFISNEPIGSRKFKEDEQRHEIEYLTENVSYLSKDIKYPSQRKRVGRENEELQKTIRNIKKGTFP